MAHELTKKRIIPFAAIALLALGFFSFYTLNCAVRPLPSSLGPPQGDEAYANILDRHGYLLSLTRKNRFNLQPVPIWRMPERLTAAFVLAEDKRFFRHRGVDWLARADAFLDNLAAGRIVRGASTITEQCIRILHPRPRTYFSRVLETIEAYKLENRFSKDEILEFYLNQVPYSHQCRGVTQAADFYFGRSLNTLNLEEILALAVMVRAPSFLNPKTRDPQGTKELHKRMLHLARRMREKGIISGLELRNLGSLKSTPKHIRVGVPHFVGYLKRQFPQRCMSGPRLITTIDRNLQGKLHHLLKQSLKRLRGEGVKHAGLLVANHRTNEIMAWVNSGDFFSQEEGSQIDAVLTLRQPGSALKPFLYALALEKGFTASTVIPDLPLSKAVGHGLHKFKNYSSVHYGPVRLRSALGNSLNVPAIRTVEHVGVVDFLDKLHQLGFSHLTSGARHYGVGLALGDGEVSLLELVRAYSVLARGGIYKELDCFLDENPPSEPKRIFSAEICSIITDILSDPRARSLEFGSSGLLEFPVQTAVKTGTSSDYRDSWAVGFNHKYTAGVWMGNLDYSPTHGVSGSRGPALVLRSVFNELNKGEETRSLFLSPRLRAYRICALSGMRASSACPRTLTEWFRPGHAPTRKCTRHQDKDGAIVTHLPFNFTNRLKTHPRTEASMKQPVPGLHIALDPRIPDPLERFPMIIETNGPVKKVKWYVDGRLATVTGPGSRQWLWKPERGYHFARAEIKLRNSKEAYPTPVTRFLVE